VHLIEILFFASIAAFFLFRLFQVLGKRSEEDMKPRPQPVQESAEPPVAPPVPQPALEGQALEGVAAIQRRDPQFDPHGFLDGAKTAYTMIVDAFADGNKEQPGDLLAPRKPEKWASLVDQRAEAGNRQISDIVRLVRAEIVSAGVEDKEARVGVHFEVDLASGMTDADGKVIQGDPSRVSRVNEVWTFVRQIRDPNPNWLLESVRQAA